MAKVQVVSNRIIGTAAAQTVVYPDDSRKFMSVAAESDSSQMSIGEVTHASAYFTMKSGQRLGAEGAVTSRVQFLGNGLYIATIQDIDSACVVTSDFVPCTYDSDVLYYKNVLAKSHGQRRPQDPVFS